MTHNFQSDDTKKTSENQLMELLNSDGDLLANILKIGIDRIMEAERDDYIGVDRYQRADKRRSSRNGHKSRQLYTRVGNLSLRVPKTRDGSFYPSILERYQRSEKALVSALAEAYVQGVSTRKMARVTEKLLGKSFSSQTISNFSNQLDAELEAWRSRPLEGTFPYVTLDARYESCRRDGQIVDIAVLVAIGVSQTGHRHILAVETGWGESETVWSEFLGKLKDRGLKGVELFTSDAHPGIKNAVKEHYPGVAWQRCQFHFIRNLLDKTPKKRHDQFKAAMRDIWAKGNTYEFAKEKLDQLIKEIEDKLPDIAEWLSEEAESTLTIFYKVPEGHRRRLRTTNSVERLHQELKRRSRVVRIFPNPQSCLRLFGAMLKEQHEDWVTGRRYLRMEKLKEFQKERENSLEDPPRKEHEVTIAMAK